MNSGIELTVSQLDEGNQAFSCPVPLLVCGEDETYPKCTQSTQPGLDLENPHLASEFCCALAPVFRAVTLKFGGNSEWRMSVEQLGKEGIWLFAHVLPLENKALILVSSEISLRGDGAAAQLDLKSGCIEPLEVSLLRDGELGCEPPCDLDLSRAGFDSEILAWILAACKGIRYGNGEIILDTIVSPDDCSLSQEDDWSLQLRSSNRIFVANEKAFGSV
jgi:hypothetical protein